VLILLRLGRAQFLTSLNEHVRIQGVEQKRVGDQEYVEERWIIERKVERVRHRDRIHFRSPRVFPRVVHELHLRSRAQRVQRHEDGVAKPSQPRRTRPDERADVRRVTNNLRERPGQNQNRGRERRSITLHRVQRAHEAVRSSRPLRRRRAHGRGRQPRDRVRHLHDGRQLKHHQRLPRRLIRGSTASNPLDRVPEHARPPERLRDVIRDEIRASAHPRDAASLARR